MSPLSVAARLLGFCLVALLPHAPLCSAAKYAFDKWKSCEELGHGVITTAQECAVAAKEQKQVLLQTGCTAKGNRNPSCTWNSNLNSVMYRPKTASQCTRTTGRNGWPSRPYCDKMPPGCVQVVYKDRSKSFCTSRLRTHMRRVCRKIYVHSRPPASSGGARGGGVGCSWRHSRADKRQHMFVCLRAHTRRQERLDWRRASSVRTTMAAAAQARSHRIMPTGWEAFLSFALPPWQVSLTVSVRTRASRADPQVFQQGLEQQGEAGQGGLQ